MPGVRACLVQCGGTRASRAAGQGRPAPFGLLAKSGEDCRVHWRALDALDGLVFKLDVDGDAAERRLPHELAWRLVVHELLLEAAHLRVHRRGQLERLRRQRRPAEARDDRRVEQLRLRVAKVALDGLRRALRLGDVAQHHLARRERRLAEALLEHLEIAHLAGREQVSQQQQQQ